jgi:hypothetical protein
MDNILEILIPLIFAAIYFFGNMFSGKSDGDSAPSSGSGRQEKDPDVIERQRKIQEEIRRKIAQRRGGEGAAPLDTESSNQASRQSQPETASYESQMQERIHRIEATERRAEKLKQEVRITRSNTTFARNPSRIARGNARSTLRDPSAARTAFIYGEILGQPISQRKTHTIPGLIK